MRVLITGANGQVGQALIENAQQYNIEALAYTKDMLDISSETMVQATLRRYQPDVVINAAAYTNVEQAEASPTQAETINAAAVGILAHACDSQDIPLLHISTDYVFSGEQRTPYSESDATSPLSVYGATKLAGEKQLFTHTKKAIVLRTSWVFSATGNNFVKTMLRLFRERTEVSVVNDQWGGPTSANAIAQALLTIATKIVNPHFSDWGIYHFSGTPIVSWYELACAIRDSSSHEIFALQKLVPILSDQFPTKATRPAYAALNLEKIKAIFEIDPCNWQKDLAIVIQQLKKEGKQ